uniref:LPXTG cell wall anchor domain-containing protein n=1 Tax=Microbacterium sp. TaxID=51671 RepID=UPI003735E701
KVTDGPSPEPTDGPTPSPQPTLPGTGDGDEGESWAQVEISASTVLQGGDVQVTLSGLTPGQRVTATLYSDPIVIEGIPAADADGVISFTVSIPDDLEPGQHTLVVETAGQEDIRIPITVEYNAQLANTGGESAPLVTLLAGAGALIILGAVLLRRRRQEV